MPDISDITVIEKISLAQRFDKDNPRLDSDYRTAKVKPGQKAGEVPQTKNVDSASKRWAEPDGF